jgi:hypothetical protein
MLRSDWPETHLFVFVLVLEMKRKFEDENDGEEDCLPPVSKLTN